MAIETVFLHSVQGITTLYHNTITSFSCGYNRIYALSSAFFSHISFLIPVELLTIYFLGLKFSPCQTPSASLNGNIDITIPGKYFILNKKVGQALVFLFILCCS